MIASTIFIPAPIIKAEKRLNERYKKYYTTYVYDRSKKKFVMSNKYRELVNTKEEAKQKEGAAVLLNNKGMEKPNWMIKGTPEFEEAVDAAIKYKDLDIYYRIDTRTFEPIKLGRFQTVN